MAETESAIPMSKDIHLHPEKFVNLKVCTGLHLTWSSPIHYNPALKVGKMVGKDSSRWRAICTR